MNIALLLVLIFMVFATTLGRVCQSCRGRGLHGGHGPCGGRGLRWGHGPYGGRGTRHGRGPRCGRRRPQGGRHRPHGGCGPCGGHSDEPNVGSSYTPDGSGKNGTKNPLGGRLEVTLPGLEGHSGANVSTRQPKRNRTE